jgi:hypothetical protein
MRRFIPSAVAVASILAGLSSPIRAQVAASSPAATAADAAASCERAVRQSLASRAGPAAELKFTGAPAVQPSLSNGGQLVMNGAGSWRSGSTLRRFEYSCNLEPRSPEAVGVLIRDLTPPSAEPAPARAAIEPDLSNLSPAACESAAAAALKKRWPAVSQLSFDTSTRRLSQDSANKALLREQGRALPAPGAPMTHFEFDCDVDPRDGRVIGMRVAS